mgnify:CR=1 FL=1
MGILKPQILSDRIVSELKNGSQRGPALMEILDRSSQKYTKQALYAALRQLIKDDVVVKHRGRYSLNTTWILQLQSFVHDAARQYDVVQGGSEILSLTDGESVSYVFTNSHTLDTFWGHAQNVLLEHTAPSEAVYAYDPHYWFVIAHQDTERTLLKHIVESKRQFLMAVGGTNALDKLIAKEFDGTYSQYAYVPQNSDNTQYVSTIGPYIISVELDQKIADRVENLFKTATASTSTVVSELRSLLSVRSKNKIKITLSTRKAARIRASLKKYFYIKKS